MSMGDEKLRARLARTKQGCRPRELDRLYVSYGFEKREGKKHTIYTHPRYPKLQAAVARHTRLHRFYVQTALTLLADLDVLEQEEKPE